ncbi:hypothetical protein GOODEAATRI_027967 [Goodea atripinnis]|uniref:WDR36/Utp21 C-terminal domain-containing protein n=1 Tax=Goodea atripinnis TaxID=208336 RepID=A0ABV0NNX0_9TELE
MLPVDQPLRLLKDCGPAGVSVELTCLTAGGGGANNLLLAFILMIDRMLATGRDFDLAHAYLALFLKVIMVAAMLETMGESDVNRSVCCSRFITPAERSASTHLWSHDQHPIRQKNPQMKEPLS